MATKKYASLENLRTFKENTDILYATKIGVEELSAGVAYIDKTDNENIENPDIEIESITVDSALSISSTNPLQNKVITQEINQLSEEKADKTEVNERFENIEYQTITSESASTHYDLPEDLKTVIFESDGSLGSKAYINYGADLFPKGGFNTSFPYNGLTIIQKGDTYKFTGQTVASTGVSFIKEGNSLFYTELPSDLIGKTVTLLAFADSLITGGNVYLNVYFYDKNKSQLSKHANYLAKTTTDLVAKFTIPEGTVYYSADLYMSSGVVFDHEIKLYMLVADDVDEVDLTEHTMIQDVSATAFQTLPYSSFVQYKMHLNEYISKFGGGVTTYLTPESFGAKGDGINDDGEAIALCLEQASISQQTVLMAQKYYTTMPIEVKQSGLSIIANDIVYDGNETAIKISGQKNTLKIHSIVSGGIGISYRADNDLVVCHNDVDVNSVDTLSHGIVFYNGLSGIYQNIIRFASIKAGGVGTYGICMLDAEGSSWVTENNFYGGQISNCEWAVYRIKGNSKLYSIQIEVGVDGGFYIEGDVTIFHPRIEETMRDGNLPIYKFLSSNNVTIYNSSPIFINQIDLSDMEETFVSTSGYILPATSSEVATINSPIMGSNLVDGRNGNTKCIYTRRAYVWGKYLIMTPYMSYAKMVKKSLLDTRTIGAETSDEEIRELTQLPTKFVVNTVNSEIYLHPSYCPFGFNEFEIEQRNDCTCKVYDVKGNLVFDGIHLGNGRYRLNAYNDAESIASTWGQWLYDYEGYYWNITHLGSDSEARERLDNLEYRITTTNPAYDHSELAENDKADLVIDVEPIWGDVAYISYGTDLLPRSGFNRGYSFNGITITQNDGVFEFSGKLTDMYSNYFKGENSDGIYNAIPAELVGARICLLKFVDSIIDDVAVAVIFYDADKNALSKLSGYLSDNTSATNSIIIPNNASYYSVVLSSDAINKEYNFKFKLYMLAKNQFEKLTLSSGKTVRNNVSATSFSTLPYQSYLRYKESTNTLKLPEVSENDNGKVLMVVNGEWQVVTLDTSV